MSGSDTTLLDFFFFSGLTFAVFGLLVLFLMEDRK